MGTTMPPVYEGKVIPRNFGHIGHLPGSKMINDEDKLIGNPEIFTEKKRAINDEVIITEKIDGSNMGVIKKDGYLYPISRKGYDVRSIKEDNLIYPMCRDWAIWVNGKYHLFDSLLNEGERVVFENAMYQHTLRYRFKCEPVFLLASYNAQNKRRNYDTLCDIASEYGFKMPPLLNRGCAIPPEVILKQYPDGVIGSRDGIEGIVYSYECAGVWESNAKFVSNSLIGTSDGFSGRYNAFPWQQMNPIFTNKEIDDYVKDLYRG